MTMHAEYDDAAFLAKAEALADILCDLDEFNRPKVKLPNCPKCDEDELGVIHADLLMCYRCGWKMTASTRQPSASPPPGCQNAQKGKKV